MFQRFFDEGLAQSSYLIACPRTRRAAVVDPRRDVDVYVAAARQHGVDIELAIETHIHADFVSGARELAATGATVLAGPGSHLRYEHREVRDGEAIELGTLRLEMLHTPGHTPEHICVLLADAEKPPRLLTGDTLFVGAVGRPDLLGDARVTRRLAAQLYDSIYRRLLSLDDGVEVHPGHGAGSLCGSGIGNEPSSTIGHERRLNPSLQHRNKEAFVAAILADLPETPPYFARMKRINHEGPVGLDLATGVRPPPALQPPEVSDLLRRGALVLDVRDAEAFGTGHITGSLNIRFSPKVGYWAGWILPSDCAIVLVHEGGDAAAIEVRRQLLRVGCDGVEGYLVGGYRAWEAAGLPTATIRQLRAGDFRGREQDFTVLDVRTTKEWATGHIEGSLHIPLGELGRRIAEIPTDRPVATICEGGLRSSLAASLLSRAGIPDVLNVRDGMSAWRTLATR